MQLKLFLPFFHRTMAIVQLQLKLHTYLPRMVSLYGFWVMSSLRSIIPSLTWPTTGWDLHYQLREGKACFLPDFLISWTLKVVKEMAGFYIFCKLVALFCTQSVSMISNDAEK